jgi:hypothetical protein
VRFPRGHSVLVLERATDGRKSSIGNEDMGPPQALVNELRSERAHVDPAATTQVSGNR